MPVNNSFFAIPASWVVAMSTHWYAIYLTKTSKVLPEFDKYVLPSFSPSPDHSPNRPIIFYSST